MILQNISKAIREQNYYAVALEFVIVIAGVVVGFQINAWNEGRQAEQQLRLQLVAVVDELRVNESRLEAYVAELQQDQANMRAFMAWIADPGADDEALPLHLFHLLPVPNLDVEQEDQSRLLSSDEFKQSSLNQVQAAISEFDRRAVELTRLNRDLVRFRNDYVHFVLADTVPFVGIISRAPASPASEGPAPYPESAFAADAEAIRADVRFENMAAMKLGLNDEALQTVGQIRAAAGSLANVIDAHLEGVEASEGEP